MNPALPTGVHIKALEVYDCIFESLGPENLSANFYKVAFGLLPFFDYCATSTKPNFLDIYDRHILPISTSIPQSLPSLISSLLPGLDENSSEYSDNVFGLLIKLEAKFDRKVFLKSLVTVFCTNSAQRANLIIFLSQRTAKEYPDLFNICESADRALFLSFISSGVEDANIIVIRGCMDIVMNKILIDSNGSNIEPFHSEVIQIMLSVLTRKDMSLSRRFLNWIGVDTRENFKFVADTLQALIQTCAKDIMKFAQLFKILTCVLDNSKLSEHVFPEIIWDIIRVTYCYASEGNVSVIKSANQFFELADLNIIWSKLLIEAQELKSVDTIDTLLFAVENLKITEAGIIQSNILPVTAALINQFQSLEPKIKIKVCELSKSVNRTILSIDPSFGMPQSC